MELGAGSATGAGVVAGGYISIDTDPSGAPVIGYVLSNQIFFLRWNGSSWQSLFTGLTVGFYPMFVLDSSGHPIVTWNNHYYGTTNDEIFVKRWNGSAWVEMGVGSATGGGISNSPGGSFFGPDIALDASGNPIVVWEDKSSGNSEIYVKRWNGTQWINMGVNSASAGGISNSAADSTYVDIAVSPAGVPVVTWHEYSYNLNIDSIYVKQWNGTSWIEMGTGSASGKGISTEQRIAHRPSIVIDYTGAPIVTWTGTLYSSDYEIYVKRWNGSAWVEMGAGSAVDGGISNNDLSSMETDIQIAPDGNPIIAWADGPINSNKDIFVRRWNGTAWVEIGTGSASDTGISKTVPNSGYPSITFNSSGNPIIAWNDNGSVFVRYFVP